MPSELAAAFLWAQMEAAGAITERRLEIWNWYYAAFEALERRGRLRRPIVPEHCRHNAHMFYAIVTDGETRTRLLDALNAAGVNAVFHYVPLHSSAAGRRFGRTAGDLPQTDSLSGRLIRFPLWIGMEQSDVAGIVGDRRAGARVSRRMRANARRMAVPAVLDGLVLAAFAGAMLTTGGATLDAAAMASLFFGGTIVAIAGSVIVAWTVGDAHPSHHVMAILLGSLTTSLVLFLGCVTTGMLAAKVFLAWSAVVLAAGAWTLRSAPEVERRDGLDVLAIVAIAILVAALCHHAAGTLPSIQATGIVPIWSDYSIHGTEIAQFGDPHVQGLSAFLLAGQPLVFYHYAPYMLPAAAAGVISLPPWGVAASLLLPYGILLMSLAVYAFARLRLGAAAATIAPAALLLVPDASTYGLRNGFFGFHWLLFTAPGSGYGLSAAFTALTLMVIWRAHHRPACFWLGIL